MGDVKDITDGIVEGNSEDLEKLLLKAQAEEKNLVEAQSLLQAKVDQGTATAQEVIALENVNANGKRFIVTTEEPYAFQEVAKILKSNGYDKVSTKLAPNFLLKIMSYLDREAKSMRSFVGKTYNGNVSLTMKTFDWKPIPIEKTVLDTAKSIESYIN